MSKIKKNNKPTKKNVSAEENPHPSHKKRLGERLLACIVA